MTMKDAAIVATIVAFIIWCLQFFANSQFDLIMVNPGAWCFEAIKNYLVNWAGTFAALAGLEQYIKRQEKTDNA